MDLGKPRDAAWLPGVWHHRWLATTAASLGGVSWCAAREESA